MPSLLFARGRRQGVQVAESMQVLLAIVSRGLLHSQSCLNTSVMAQLYLHQLHWHIRQCHYIMASCGQPAQHATLHLSLIHIAQPCNTGTTQLYSTVW